MIRSSAISHLDIEHAMHEVVQDLNRSRKKKGPEPIYYARIGSTVVPNKELTARLTKQSLQSFTARESINFLQGYGVEIVKLEKAS